MFFFAIQNLVDIQSDIALCSKERRVVWFYCWSISCPGKLIINGGAIRPTDLLFVKAMIEVFPETKKN